MNPEPKINTENLPSKDDINESLHLNEKRRSFYIAVQDSAWFAAREAQLQARIDRAKQDLVQLHDARQRALECLKECDLHQKHLEATLEKIDEVAEARRAEQAKAKGKSEPRLAIPAIAMVKLRAAFPSMSDQQIINMMLGKE